MLKGILSLILFSVIVVGYCSVFSQTTSVSTGVSKDVNQSQDVDPTAMSTKVKAFFNKNEQKQKVMRSKDVVKYKKKILTIHYQKVRIFLCAPDSRRCFEYKRNER